MRLPAILPATDHGSEIGLLAVIAVGDMILMGFGLWNAVKNGVHFDPSAYLVVITLIVGAIKERWLSRSVDRMGQSLASAPAVETDLNSPSGSPEDPASVVVVNPPEAPAQVELPEGEQRI